MQHRTLRQHMLACALAFVCTSVAASEISHPDHYEFDATLTVPFKVVDANFPIRVDFDYPGAGGATQAAWMVEVIAPNGRVIGSDSDITALKEGRGLAVGRWNGLGANGRSLPSGYYTVRLRAVPTLATTADARLSIDQHVQQAFAAFSEEMVEQRYDVMLGKVPAARSRRSIRQGKAVPPRDLQRSIRSWRAAACRTPSTTATCTARPITAMVARQSVAAVVPKYRRPARWARAMPTR